MPGEGEGEELLGSRSRCETWGRLRKLWWPLWCAGGAGGSQQFSLAIFLLFSSFYWSFFLCCNRSPMFVLHSGGWTRGSFIWLMLCWCQMLGLTRAEPWRPCKYICNAQPLIARDVRLMTCRDLHKHRRKLCQKCWHIFVGPTAIKIRAKGQVVETSHRPCWE